MIQNESYFVENGYVYLRQELFTGSVAVALYDMPTHTELAYDGSVVTATVKDYLGNLADSFQAPIVFEYAGDTFSAIPVNGVATMAFVVTAPGDHVVRTKNEGIRNGEVTINV